jgi:hypothetical protein
LAASGLSRFVLIGRTVSGESGTSMPNNARNAAACTGCGHCLPAS